MLKAAFRGGCSQSYLGSPCSLSFASVTPAAALPMARGLTPYIGEEQPERPLPVGAPGNAECQGGARLLLPAWGRGYQQHLLPGLQV